MVTNDWEEKLGAENKRLAYSHLGISGGKADTARDPG